MQANVSVVIPAYDEEDCIGDCLDSLARQTLEHEVIVVDDGSRDRTAAAARERGVLVLRQEHGGPGTARNLGAAAARGDILAFLDADMTFAPDFLEKLVAPIVAGEAVGTFTRDELLGNSERAWARFFNLASGLPADRRLPADYPDRSTVFRAISREAFERAGGYDDTGCGEDLSISRKLGVEAVRAEGAVCWHRNPSGVRDVFRAARWYGKSDVRPHSLPNYVRLLPPVALARAARVALRRRSLSFGAFQLVHDAGTLAGFIAADVLRSHHAR